MLLGATAEDWACQTGATRLRLGVVEVADACDLAHGYRQYVPSYSNLNDPNSWQCWAEDTPFPQPPGGADASFVRLDTRTQGTWKGTYGADGYHVVSDRQSLPSYAQMSVTDQTEYVWTDSTGDARATQRAEGTDRLAARWYSGTAFTVDLNLTDGKTHQVALYALDWDSYGPRNQTVEVRDAGSGALVDRRTISGFERGQYLVWNLKGHLKVEVKNNNSNAVLSAIFFGGGA